jgi:hypothetical protein
MKCSLCQTVVEPGTEICPNCTADIIVDDVAVAKTPRKEKPSRSEKAESSESLSKSTKIILAVAGVLVIGAAAAFGIPKLLNRTSTPESFAGPAEVFVYLEVVCPPAEPQQGTDQGTGSPYTILTCGEDYFALTMDSAATAIESAKLASAQMPATYHMYTLSNSIVVATVTASEKLVADNPDLVLVK